MIKRILMICAAVMVSVSAMAQEADRESLGFFSSSSYPLLRLPLGPKTYTLLENGDVARRGTVVGDNMMMGNVSMKWQSNPGSADLIFSYTNLREESPIEVDFYDPKKKHRPIKIGKIVIDTRPKEEREGPHAARPGYACAYLYRDVSFYVSISKPDGTVLYEDFVGESSDFNSGWWVREQLAVDSVMRAASGMTLATLIKRNSLYLAELVGASCLMCTKKVTCYYAKKSKRTKGADPYAEINASVDKLKKASELIKLNEWDIETFKSATAGCVEVWENELKNVNLNDKKARINAEVACGLNYNIAVYYLFCKEFDKAAKYFKEVVLLDKRFGDCRYFAEGCDKWQLAKESYEKKMASPEATPAN